MTRQRVLIGSAGVLLILFGMLTLSDSVPPRSVVWLPVWLAGAVATDDGVLIPVTLAAGWLLARWHRTGATASQLALVRTALTCAAVTTLIAFPLIARQGKGANSTALSRDYLRDWLLLEATIAAAAVAGVLIVTAYDHRPGRGDR